MEEGTGGVVTAKVVVGDGTSVVMKSIPILLNCGQ